MNHEPHEELQPRGSFGLTSKVLVGCEEQVVSRAGGELIAGLKPPDDGILLRLVQRDGRDHVPEL